MHFSALRVLLLENSSPVFLKGALIATCPAIAVVLVIVLKWLKRQVTLIFDSAPGSRGLCFCMKVLPKGTVPEQFPSFLFVTY